MTKVKILLPLKKAFLGGSMNDFNSGNGSLLLINHFKQMKYYRIELTKKYESILIIMIAICAVIAGADYWV